MRTIYLCLCAVALALVHSACDDKRRHGANEDVHFTEVKPPVPDGAAPQDAALALLDAIKKAQAVRASGLGVGENRSTYDQAMAEVVSLAAAKEIHKHVLASRSLAVPKDVTENAAVRMVAESWVSICAHYVDGFLPDTLVASPAGPTDFASVQIDAESPADRQVLLDLQAADDSPAATQPASTAGPTFRAEAIARGVAPPIRARFEIRLQRVSSGWRVLRVNVGPAAPTQASRSIQVQVPTTAPVTSSSSSFQ